MRSVDDLAETKEEIAPEELATPTTTEPSLPSAAQRDSATRRGSHDSDGATRRGSRGSRTGSAQHTAATEEHQHRAVELFNKWRRLARQELRSDSEDSDSDFSGSGAAECFYFSLYHMTEYSHFKMLLLNEYMYRARRHRCKFVL